MKCGNTVPVSDNMTDEQFQKVIAKVLVPDAIKTLRQHNQPMAFQVFWYPERKLLGWANEDV